MSAIVYAEHASEGGHWYDSTGRLVVTVPGSRGQQVEPDVRHARKLDLGPGVTTIIKAQNQPGLTVYREKQALMCALTTTRLAGESDDAMVARIMVDAKAAAVAAAERGTAIHAEVESHFRDCPPAHLWSQRALAVHTALYELTGGRVDRWHAERPAVSPLGFATKSDLSAEMPSLPGSSASAWVVDLKTKDGALENERAWDEHAQQLAATRLALHATYPDAGFAAARCAIVFVSRTEIAARAVEIEEPELQRGEECFRALVRYWRAKNRHRPTWATEEP